MDVHITLDKQKNQSKKCTTNNKSHHEQEKINMGSSPLYTTIRNCVK